jgi:uncharacterized protein involved in exopolysaccharide biosynthesis
MAPQLEDKGLIVANSAVPARTATIRDYVAIGFRWRYRMLLVFAVTAITGVLVAFYIPPEYESVMKMLVTRERVDPLVTVDQTAAGATRDISEEDLNSEVELIKSDDVLRNVVLATGLQRKIKPGFPAGLLSRSSGNSDVVRTEEAVRQLNSALSITLPKKSNVIRISYRSKDARLSAAVLTALSKFYLQKHLAVHRPPGQFEFFDRQVEQARRNLSDVQAKLRESARQSQMYAGSMDLDLVVQKLADQRLALQQTYTEIGETEKRIAALEKQLGSTPSRMTTAVRTADNPELLMQLKNTLLQLELKRTDLLQKFEPTYRLVQEVDVQIAQTKSAIAAAESAPVTDRTTDRDPTYEWMRSELAKARTELISLQARAASIARYTAQYTERARVLSDGNLQQQQLLANAKALEDTYQLYLRRREEARISDALDQNKIVNVSIAQQPSLPALPARSPVMTAVGAIFFGLLLSMGTGFASERLDNLFRSPEDVQTYLDIPVIAALPARDAGEIGGSGQMAGV